MMNNTKFYTYLHCRPDGSPFYVGKGCGGRSHSFTHQRSRYHRSVIAKYGSNNIGVFVFPCDTEEQAFADEIQQIAQLKRDGYDLVNHTNGGEGSSGYKHSIESRAKMSASSLGRKISEAHKKAISASNLGKVRSKETRLKISKSRKGITISKEHREKLRAALLGRKRPPRSAEWSAKIALAAMGNKRHLGIKHSQETKIKISISRKKLFEKRRLS